MRSFKSELGEDGKVSVFDQKGKEFRVWPVDAREHLRNGLTLVPGKPVEPEPEDEDPEPQPPVVDPDPDTEEFALEQPSAQAKRKAK